MAETGQSTPQKHTGRASGGETEEKCTDVGKEVSSEKSTPVKMYSLPNIFNQSTPLKESPQSEASSSKSTPGKLKTHDLKHIQDKVDQFCSDMDIEYKACLYSVTKNDTGDSTKSLERLRRKGKAFQKEMSYSIDICLKDTAALVQNNATLSNYVNMLRREKDVLQIEVDNLKKEKALQELKDIDCSLLDDSEDDDEFICSGTKKLKNEENE